MMRISGVVFRQFPPFADAEMDFPQSASGNSVGEVQLFTGQNGTGKTRLLCLLAAACGNGAPLNARFSQTIPARPAVMGECDNDYGVWLRGHSDVFWFRGQTPEQRAREYACSGNRGSPQFFSHAITSRKNEDPQAATAFAFRGMARVSEAKIAAVAPLKLGSPSEHLLFEPAKNEDELICQSMANLKMAAAMDTLRMLTSTDSRAIRLIQRVEETISRITGRKFAFEVTPHPEVRLRVFWGGVTMGLSQLPDGLRSILGWLVSCVAKLDAQFPEHPDLLNVSLILLLDEPEGHLHPAWQRKVLPAAQTLFPKAQIFAATHSPFIISSVNEGWIHIFRGDDSGIVKVDKPISCSKGDTYLDVVEDILGVKEWYDPETEGLLVAFRHTREEILAGRNEYDKLVAQAKTIAERSDSLRDIMAREMRQVERLTGRTASHP